MKRTVSGTACPITGRLNQPSPPLSHPAVLMISAFPNSNRPTATVPTSNRVLALDIVTSAWFDRTILFFIGLNSAFLALTDYEHIDGEGEPVSDTAPQVVGLLPPSPPTAHYTPSLHPFDFC